MILRYCSGIAVALRGYIFMQPSPPPCAAPHHQPPPRHRPSIFSTKAGGGLLHPLHLLALPQSSIGQLSNLLYCGQPPSSSNSRQKFPSPVDLPEEGNHLRQHLWEMFQGCPSFNPFHFPSPDDLWTTPYSLRTTFSSSRQQASASFFQC